MTHQRFNVLDVNVSAVNPDTAFEMIDRMIQNQKPGYVCIAPVSTIIDCQDNEDYRQIVNNADMVTPDGMPLVWLARAQGHREVRRTYGPDLMLRVCKESEVRGYRHFFFGGGPGIVGQLEQKLKEKFRLLKVAGKYSPPFSPDSQAESQVVIDMINGASPDILWVGLGSPKQDFWMYKNRDKLNAPVMIGVGAAFDFISGTKKQAPVWMRRSGLEWLFRLVSEPRRLWRRYLVGNTRFLCLLLRNSIQNVFKTRP